VVAADAAAVVVVDAAIAIDLHGASPRQSKAVSLPSPRNIPFLSLALILGGCLSVRAELVDLPHFGVRVERGFRMTEFVNEQLADDIWCMTLNPRGEAVVSGAGYIRTLLDIDGDGRADKAVQFAKTKGAMGLCFDKTGKQLLVMGDGWLSEYRDDNLDRIADGPPRRLFKIADGEHGGHAIRIGPDGWWWAIGGNDSGIHKSAVPAPTGQPFTAGALVRIAPDFSRVEVAASGFRNPYDFDFNERGEVFTYDSDCERDYFLPWYSPCRIYHVRLGRHHGWRLPGFQRSFRVPDYMPETVPALADMGRGSPTGVLCYREGNFPKRYLGGLFFCDWTFGRVHFAPLIPQGEGYVAKPEIFLEPIGTAGFAPTDIVQTADGALLISIGGRKTRGAVYRIEPDRIWHGEPAILAAGSDPPGALRDLSAHQAALGGWKLEKASAEAFTAYEPAKPDGLKGNDRKAALESARNLLMSLDDQVRAEAARLLAMLEDDSDITMSRMLTDITDKSPPTSDFHYLACFARLRAERTPDITAKVARAILDLDMKLAGGDRRPKQNWATRLNEVVAALIARDSSLPDALFRAPDFATPGHVPLADALPASHRLEAARLYLLQPGIQWSPELVRIIGALPAGESHPLLRAQWDNKALRPALRAALQRNATPEDQALLARADAPPPAEGDPAPFIESLKQVAWANGDAARGGKIFRERACATCHAGTSPLGPELSGPVARLSAIDLMTEIQFPSRNIAEAFRTTVFHLKDGGARNALVAFTSADGVIIRTGPGVSERLAESDIVSRSPGAASLMPPASLTGLKAEDLADLHAYLRTLKAE
jgi:putative membrane-bound dehydrogenase-like protein